MSDDLREWVEKYIVNPFEGDALESLKAIVRAREKAAAMRALEKAERLCDQDGVAANWSIRALRDEIEGGKEGK